MGNFRYFLAIISFLFQLHFSKAQTYAYYGDKTFGGSLVEKWVEMTDVGNGEFIIYGSSTTIADGDKTDSGCYFSTLSYGDLWCVKFDTAFNIIWNKSIGGSDGEINPHLILTGNDGKMIFSSRCNSDSSCDKSDSCRGTFDYWIYMLDKNGNKIWDKTYGGTNPDNFPRIARLTTSSYVIAGGSDSQIGADKTVANYGSYDYWVVKMDNAGNKLWDNVYGGSGFETAWGGNSNGFSLLADDSDSFIIAGRTSSPVSGNISDPGQGGTDIWIIKIDSSGNKIWDKRYGGTTSELCDHIIKTGDGYIVAGSTISPQGGSVSDTLIGGYDVWIIKLDIAGNKQWDKRYGGTGDDKGVSISVAPGGGYWVSASTESPMGFDIKEPPYGARDYWIFKIDSAGNKLWDKRFGGPGSNDVSNFVIMPDSSIYLCGFADSGITAVKTDAGKGLSDYWIVHFKYQDNTTGINEATNSNNQISVFPNPTKGILNYRNNSTGSVLINVSNLLGEEVYNNKVFMQKQNTLNVSSLQNGMYFLKIQNEKISSIVKFIKE